MDIKNISLECDTDLSKYTSSMLFPSETVIAKGKFEVDGKKYSVSLEVRGNVAVTYYGETYHSPEDFPEELIELIKAHPHDWDVVAPTGEGNDELPIYVGNNNWFEYIVSDETRTLEGYCCENDVSELSLGDIKMDMVKCLISALKLDTNSSWLHTDDDQWLKKICDKSFELVEIRKCPDGYVVAYGKINLNDYSAEDITSCVTGYGYASIEDVKDQYHTEANQVIAECLFEQTSELELGTLPVAATYEEAAKLADEYMKEN